MQIINYMNQLFIITSFLTPSLSIVLGLYCLIYGSRSQAVRMWFYYCLTAALWSVGLLSLIVSSNLALADISNKVLHVGAAFIPIVFYHFISLFLFRLKKDRIYICLGYFLAILFSFLSLFSKLLVSGVSAKIGFSYWADAGVLYPFFVLFFWVYIILALYMLVANYVISNGIRRKQLFYIILASLIGFIGGGTNFLPQLFGIYPFGNYFTWLFPVLITYGIFIK